jgi:nitroreductase
MNHPIANLTCSSSDIVDASIVSRKSTRAFLSEPVPLHEVLSILSVASHAPSGANTQPWKVYIVSKPRIEEIYTSITGSGINPQKAIWDDYQYYPERFLEPYLKRRRELGASLYGLLGISKRDIRGMRSQFARNFKFFGAPCGLFIAIDRELATGSWLDLGMFIQNILISAQGRGIATCPQAAFAPFHKFIRPILSMKNSEILVCGIAIGFEDKERAENKLRTTREELDSWVRVVPN